MPVTLLLILAILSALLRAVVAPLYLVASRRPLVRGDDGTEATQPSPGSSVRPVATGSLPPVRLPVRRRTRRRLQHLPDGARPRGGASHGRPKRASLHGLERNGRRDHERRHHPGRHLRRADGAAARAAVPAGLRRRPRRPSSTPSWCGRSSSRQSPSSQAARPGGRHGSAEETAPPSLGQRRLATCGSAAGKCISLCPRPPMSLLPRVSTRARSTCSRLAPGLRRRRHGTAHRECARVPRHSAA